MGYDETVVSIRWKDPIIQASMLGLDRILEALLRDPYSEGIRKPESLFQSALMGASFHGLEKIARRLLDYGADANNDQAKRDNLLSVASSKGHGKKVQSLVLHGIMVHDQESNYDCALICAALKGHKSTVQLLLDQIQIQRSVLGA